MDKKKVCAYSRVSTAKSDQLNSYDNQFSYFTKLAKDNEDKWIFTKLYGDRGLTGTSLNNRPEFHQMVRDGGVDVIETRQSRQSKKIHYNYQASQREPLFNLILVSNTSRFARNVMSIEIIRRLREKKVFVYFTEINKSTEELADEFLIQLLQLLDEQDSKEKSRKVKFGHLQSAEKGMIFTNDKIYGFNYIKENNSLEIREEEAEVVRLIYNLYLDGYGARRIINELDKKNILNRSGKSFVKSTISRILSNEKYAGILVRNKYQTGVIFEKHYPKVNPEDEWIVFEDHDRIPAIITKEIFYEAKKIRESNVSHVNLKGKYKGLSEYGGMVFCGKCGSSYTKNIDKGRIFYNCSLKKRKSLKECDNININKNYLDQSIDELADGGYYADVIHDLDVEMNQLTNLQYSLIYKIDQDDQKLIEDKKKELSTIKQNNERLANMLFDNKVTEDYFNAKTNEFAEKIAELERDIYQMSKTAKEIVKDIHEIEVLKTKLQKIEIKEKYTKDEILDEIEKIEISRQYDDNKEPNITFYYKAISTINRMTQKYEDIKYMHQKNIDELNFEELDKKLKKTLDNVI